MLTESAFPPLDPPVAGAGVVRVVLVDDHLSIIEGFAGLLNLEADLRVVGLFTDGARLLDQVAVVPADVILMDIHMPGLNGLATARRLQQHYPATQIIILTQSTDAAAIAEAFAAGVRGYLIKTSGIVQIVRAIRQVRAGLVVIDPAIQATVLAEFQRLRATPPPRHATLTAQEYQIIRGIVADQSNREIADHLHLGLRTVENYLNAIFQKLAVRSRTQLAVYAVRHQLVEGDSSDPAPAA